MRLSALLTAAALLVVLAPPASSAAASGPRCAGVVERAAVASGTTPSDHALATWLEAWSEEALDEVLLDAEAIAGLNARNRVRPEAFQDVVLGLPRATPLVTEELEHRLNHLLARFESQRLVEGRPGTFGAAAAIMRAADPVDEVRVLVQPADLRCMPTREGYFTVPIDRDFDRNQCSRLHPGEVVRVSRRSADGAWLYVHTGYAVGWLHEPAVTPPLAPTVAARFRDEGPRLFILEDWVPLYTRTSTGTHLRLGTGLPLIGRDADGWWHVVAPTDDGLAPALLPPDAHVHVGPLPFTRRHLLTRAMALLGDEYGWGGLGGGRDCSRYVLDLMALFGIHLGRNSATQSLSGTTTRELDGLSELDKLVALRQAGASGVVLLYMPGHIMLYLGERHGVPHAISAISEYLVPCPGGGHRVHRLDKVEVTTLELGRGTERTSFLERITRLAVFGP